MDKNSNDLLSSIASGLGINTESPFMRISRDWNVFTGDELAEKCKPVELKDGCLRVECRTSASFALFTMKKDEIMSAINRTVPDSGLKKIRSVVRIHRT